MDGRFIDLDLIQETAARQPLPDEHSVKMFAMRLPAWHPVRELLTGDAQWLGRHDAMYACLRLFSEVYAVYLQRAHRNGALAAMAPLDQAAIEAEISAFVSDFPPDVLYYGRRYSLHRLRERAVLEITTEVFSAVRTEGIAAFNRTLAQLVRAVRLS